MPRVISAGLLLLVFCPPASHGQSTPLPRPDAVVEARAYVSLAPVPRGRAFELAVLAEVRPGFHINAHEASEDYLIPTTLEADLPPGFRALGTIYPPGVLRSLKFSAAKLRVYEGRVTLRMKLEATPSAPLGRHELPLTLRYQACSQEACLPPVKIPVTVQLEVVPAGSAARPAHPTIFAVPQARRLRRAEPPKARLCRRDYGERRAGSARRSRLTTESLPSTTIVSKSGGATAWPTMATRAALMSKPAFTPSASAKARSTRSQAS